MLKPIRANSGLVEVKIPLQLPRIPGGLAGQGKSFLLLTISKVGGEEAVCTEIPYLNHMRVSYQDVVGQIPDIIHADDIWTELHLKFDSYGVPDFGKYRKFFEKTWVLVRIASVSAVDVQFLVDTNDPVFATFAQDELLINVNCRRMVPKIPFHGTSSPIRVDLGGGPHPDSDHNNPAAFKPVVSIDFGNQSTVAAIQSSTDQLPDYKLVHLDSVVGLISFDSNPDRKNGQEYLCVGRSPKEHYTREGIQFVTGGQFQGYNAVTQRPACDLKMAHKFPKRALTHPDAEIDLGNKWDFKLAGNIQSLERLKIHSRMSGQGGDGFVLAPKRLPAELFLTDLLERISGLEIDSIPERVGTPAGLVLTHPTTYSAREIMLLKKAVTRAFLRRKNITPKEPNENKGIEHKGMPKKKLGGAFNPGFKCESIVDGVIDEASAAAYYYLRKHVISDKTFGIRGFRVLHPEGTRIIIVDCGAGTTDVAAFTIKTVDANGKLRLEANLEGLTGDQVFCGDLITRKIGRLIRAKLYCLYLNNQQNQNVMELKPNNSWSNLEIELDQKLSDFLAEYEGGANRGEFPLIDTTFLANDQYLESKMTRLGFFVKEAERIKVAIGELIRKGNKDDQVRKVQLDNAFIYNVMKDAALELDNIGSIFIDDQEIKWLVENDIRRLASTINQAMLLPTNKTKSPGDHCVSKVLLTGKGSLYPLLGTILREDLSLVDPSKQVQELFELEHGATAPEAALKNCVAIGACWWWADANANGPEIKFSSQRQDKLPFDLCVKDGNVNLPKVIFKEGTPYKEMVNGAPGAILEFDNPVTQITLYRRFPGCPDYQSFLDFGFDGEGVRKVSISWNEDDLEFDVSGDDRAWHSKSRPDGLTSQYFLSPLWSGTL